MFDGWGRDLEMMLLQRSLPTAAEGTGLEVSTEIISYQQVLDRINTMMSAVGRRENASDVRSLLGSRIRFLRNSQFVRWTTGDPSTASLYVYDRVEVDMALAGEFGNDEERHHGLLAQRELGHCRDVPAVLAGMGDARPEVRMAAIAAAGFLGGVEVEEESRRVASLDPVLAVRASGQWATRWQRRCHER